WAITLADVLLALAILLLLLEVIKGARPGARYLTDHLLSLVLFGAAAAEFVLWPKFASSTFFLLTLLALVEFFCGLALHVRRGAAGGGAAGAAPPAGGAAPGGAPARRPGPPAAESARRAQGAPKRVAAAGPTVPSPDLQPSSGASAPPDKP